MNEQILRAWAWATIMGMVAVAACGALLLLQQGLLAALDSAAPQAACRIGLAAMLAIAAGLLTRYRRDLI
jgi:choline-glycine betaine transporter